MKVSAKREYAGANPHGRLFAPETGHVLRHHFAGYRSLKFGGFFVDKAVFRLDFLFGLFRFDSSAHAQNFAFFAVLFPFFGGQIGNIVIANLAADGGRQLFNIIFLRSTSFVLPLPSTFMSSATAATVAFPEPPGTNRRR